MEQQACLQGVDKQAVLFYRAHINLFLKTRSRTSLFNAQLQREEQQVRDFEGDVLGPLFCRVLLKLLRSRDSSDLFKMKRISLWASHFGIRYRARVDDDKVFKVERVFVPLNKKNIFFVSHDPKKNVFFSFTYSKDDFFCGVGHEEDETVGGDVEVALNAPFANEGMDALKLHLELLVLAKQFLCRINRAAC